MKNIRSHPSAFTGRCDYLGLKDDSQTCLAFASNWNYCHRARPPESVRIEHQRLYCHTPDHVQCPIFRNDRLGPLPFEVRGRHLANANRVKRSTKLPGLFLFLILALLILWLAGSPSLLTEIQSSLSGESTSKSASSTRLAIESPTGQMVLVVGTEKVGSPVSTKSPAPVPTIYSTFTASPSRTAASHLSTPSPEGICGHPLDSYFGTEHIFLIHQAQNGDSLNMYANAYHTSVEAIQAINFRLPIPLRKEWVLVIPVEETQVENLPAFEPQQITLTNSSVEELARQLSADQTAFEQYNAFDESCHAFSGWVLVPRQRPSP